MPNSPEKEILNQLFDDQNKFEISSDQEPLVDKKVETLIEKVEKDINSVSPINDSAGQPLLSQTATITPPLIILPLTKKRYFSKVKQRVENSFLWLRHWCGRLLKIFGERASFAEETNNGNK